MARQNLPHGHFRRDDSFPSDAALLLLSNKIN
jgi:hypothetical protein